MNTLHSRYPFLLALALLVFTLAAPVHAGQYSRMVVFGDSLSDPGNAYALTGQLSRRPYALIPDAAYATGGLHFSNGSTWAEVMGASLGLAGSVGPAFKTPVFSNYAVGAARARPVGAMSLPTQVSIFLGQNANNAPADALYVIFVGGNDVRDAIEPYVNPDYVGPPPAAIIGGAVQSIADAIQLLLDAGARHVLVVNAPNLGVVPAVTAQGPAAQFLAQLLSINFNTGLSGALALLQADPRLDLIPFDLFTFLNQVIANPGLFGFSESAVPCITPGVVVGAVCSNASDYMFWDGIHPTASGHKVIANAVESALAQ